jgi:hypothetical protein
MERCSKTMASEIPRSSNPNCGRDYSISP